MIPEEGVSFKDMYQYHCCPELGVGRAALRRFPCNCPACDEQIRMDWDYGLDLEEANNQRRFQQAKDCHYREVLGEYNKWYLVEIELSDKTDQEETDEAHQNALYHRTSVMAQGMDVGQIGAVATSDEQCPDGYYLLEFSSLPYTEQDEIGYLKCKGYWMYKLPMAPHWYYTSYREEVAVDLMNVVMTGVQMEKLEMGTILH